MTSEERQMLNVLYEMSEKSPLDPDVRLETFLRLTPLGGRVFNKSKSRKAIVDLVAEWLQRKQLVPTPRDVEFSDELVLELTRHAREYHKRKELEEYKKRQKEEQQRQQTQREEVIEGAVTRE
jgi:hypothetical protein